MNIDHDDTLPEDLRRSLRGLRRDAAPARDLWPGIRASIANAPPVATPVAATPPPPSARSGRSRRTRRLAGLATAASLAAALAIAWTIAPPRNPAPQGITARLILQEAARMTDEYRSAWNGFDAHRPADVDASALHEIDRNAAAVRAALRKDPDARYLFERLQSLYAQRLDLSRRLSTLSS